MAHIYMGCLLLLFLVVIFSLKKILENLQIFDVGEL